MIRVLSLVFFNPRMAPTVTSATSLICTFLFFGVLCSETLLSLSQSSGVRPHWLMGFLKESSHSSKYGTVSGPQLRLVGMHRSRFPGALAAVFILSCVAIEVWFCAYWLTVCSERWSYRLSVGALLLFLYLIENQGEPFGQILNICGKI